MGRLKERIRFGIVGLGWVGQEVARAALEDPRVKLVGIADSDPMKAGRDLGELIGEGRLGLPIESTAEGMLARARPEVAVVCTETDIETVAPILDACVAQGAHVLTTCENLVDPDLGRGQLAADFDDRARGAGVVVLATGVNPGFAMDRLPVVLAQATRNIRRIRVARFVDAGTRRAQLQQKAGVGLTPHGFSEAIRHGHVGHVGLAASLKLIARGVGVPLDKTAEVFTPVLAASPTTSTIGAVPSGRVRGIHQVARGYRGDREVITLELIIAVDEPEPRDTIDIVGEPPLHFEGELPGDQCTVATVLSAVSVVVSMAPGLRTVLDLPLEQPEEPEGVDLSIASSRAHGFRAATELPGPSADAAGVPVSWVPSGGVLAPSSEVSAASESSDLESPETDAPTADGPPNADASPGVVRREVESGDEVESSSEESSAEVEASAKDQDSTS